MGLDPGRPARTSIARPIRTRCAIDAAAGDGDPLGANLAAGAPVGLLGIELATRRRNRMNGTVVAPTRAGFAVRVRQSFGNCPQYIQAREPIFVADRRRVAGGRARRSGCRALDAAARALVAARRHVLHRQRHGAARIDGRRAEGVDVSHRGGKPGFVRVEEDGRTC